MSSFIGEFIGTMLLIIMGNGVVANVVLNKTKGNNSGWIVITFGWAIAVFVGVFVASKYSEAHLNPAVTLALVVLEKITWDEALQYVGGQMCGAMLGSVAVWAAYRQHFIETGDPELKRAVFCTTPAIRSTVHNLITEIIGTFVLVFAVLFIIA